MPASFSDENVQSPAFIDLISRIELAGNPAFDLGSGEFFVQTRSASMTERFPETRDSKTVESRVEPANEKFAALATPVVGDNATRLRDLVVDLAQLPAVREICAFLRQHDSLSKPTPRAQRS